MYDNFQGHFILTTSPVNLLSSPLPPEMWVAVSAGTDPCGTWTVYDLTFSGGPFALRATLAPRIGQDRTAVLVEADVLNPGVPAGAGHPAPERPRPGHRRADFVLAGLRRQPDLVHARSAGP